MLKKTCLYLLLIIFIGCGQDYNSNSNDQGQYSSLKIDSTTPEGARFGEAYQVIQSKCIVCHSWANYDTSEKWIQSGYVTQGNFNGSALIKRLKNFGGNMPGEPYSALTDGEVATLQNWITNL